MSFQNRSAYGEIFQIPTNYIDGIANKVWQEQKIREQQKLQQDKALEDEFAKNVAGVKSSDIPDITKAYSDFKQAHINLQKKGQKATPQDQMDVMIKKANAFQAIAVSKEDKERIKQRLLEVKADKKGIYNPDAHTTLSEMLNTPTSQRKLDEDDDRLKYKYAMPNIDKEIANAAGKGQEIEISVGVDDKDPLKDKVEVYKTINPPNVFYNNLFTGLASRSDNKGFIRSTMDKYTDEEKNDLRTAYEARIADPKFKALYGETKPFPESAANTELGQATALKTMEAVVNLPIEKIKDKSVLNADRNKARGVSDKIDAENRANREWDRRRPLRFADSMALMKANKAANLPPTDTGYLSDEVAAQYGQPQKVRLNGVERDVNVIYVDDVDPARLDIITGKDLSKKKLGVKPIPIKQADGKVRFGYYQDAGTGDWEGEEGQKISRERVKDDYIKTVSPTKFKVQAGTKASENTKGNTPTSKPAAKPKKDPLGLGF
jgi:hypothetical protein